MQQQSGAINLCHTRPLHVRPREAEWTFTGTADVINSKIMNVEVFTRAFAVDGGMEGEPIGIRDGEGEVDKFQSLFPATPIRMITL